MRGYGFFKLQKRGSFALATPINGDWNIFVCPNSGSVFSALFAIKSRHAVLRFSIDNMIMVSFFIAMRIRDGFRSSYFPFVFKNAQGENRYE